jgi:hypothetical protein
MKYFLPWFFGALFFLLCNSASTFAAVRINEVAWMGTATSQYNEWIELYNDGDNDVSLKGWTIYKTGNVLLFTLTKTIAANGYLLIEHNTPSAPDAVPGINDEAGTFGGGGLKNTGEDLVLKDDNGNPVNTLPYSSGWPAGDAKTKQTMQWTGTVWITATGTPDAVNASVADDTSNNTSSDTAPVVQTQSPAVVSVPVQNIITPATTVPPSSITSDSSVQAPAAVAQQTTNITPATSPTPVASDEAVSVEAPANVIPNNVITSSQTDDSEATVSGTVIKKSSTKKKVASNTSTSKSTAGIDTPANDSAAAQLQVADDSAPKENNHTKIIVVAVVALIGTALFLLLERSKASQE